MLAGDETHEEHRTEVVDGVEVGDRDRHVGGGVLHRHGPGAGGGVGLVGQALAGDDRPAHGDRGRRTPWSSPRRAGPRPGAPAWPRCRPARRRRRGRASSSGGRTGSCAVFPGRARVASAPHRRRRNRRARARQQATAPHEHGWGRACRPGPSCALAAIARWNPSAVSAILLTRSRPWRRSGRAPRASRCHRCRRCRPASSRRRCRRCHRCRRCRRCRCTVGCRSGVVAAPVAVNQAPLTHSSGGHAPLPPLPPLPPWPAAVSAVAAVATLAAVAAAAGRSARAAGCHRSRRHPAWPLRPGSPRLAWTGQYKAPEPRAR